MPPGICHTPDLVEGASRRFRFGGGVVVEHRFVDAVLEGIERDELVVQGRIVRVVSLEDGQTPTRRIASLPSLWHSTYYHYIWKDYGKACLRR